MFVVGLGLRATETWWVMALEGLFCLCVSFGEFCGFWCFDFVSCVFGSELTILCISEFVLWVLMIC